MTELETVIMIIEREIARLDNDHRLAVEPWQRRLYELDRERRSPSHPPMDPRRFIPSAMWPSDGTSE